MQPGFFCSNDEVNSLRHNRHLYQVQSDSRVIQRVNHDTINSHCIHTDISQLLAAANDNRLCSLDIQISSSFKSPCCCRDKTTCVNLKTVNSFFSTITHTCEGNYLMQLVYKFKLQCTLVHSLLRNYLMQLVFKFKLYFGALTFEKMGKEKCCILGLEDE